MYDRQAKADSATRIRCFGSICHVETCYGHRCTCTCCASEAHRAPELTPLVLFHFIFLRSVLQFKAEHNFKLGVNVKRKVLYFIYNLKGANVGTAGNILCALLTGNI